MMTMRSAQRYRLLTVNGLISTLAIASPVAAQTELASRSRFGGAANDNSLNAMISGNGRFIAFDSAGNDLVAGDVGGFRDVFRFDRTTGTVIRVSRTPAGSDANGDSEFGSTTSDGQLVAFESDATNLIPGDSNGLRDVFVFNVQTSSTVRVSISSDGTQTTDGDSGDAMLAANGRYVAFVSNASNLVPGDNNGSADVFVRDLLNNTTTLVSRATGPSGIQAAGGVSLAPAISADGRYVAFVSSASNLLGPGVDTNSSQDVFVRDLVANTTTLVSRAAGASGAQAGDHSISPSISADGRYVAFVSLAANLLGPAGDTNSAQDVFVRDLVGGTTTLASRASGPSGVQALGGASAPSISADGRYVAFVSLAANLLGPAGDTNSAQDVFVRDLVGGTTTLASRASGPSGLQASNTSFAPSISGDGRFVAFDSDAANLVSGDLNGTRDVFVRDVRSSCPGDADGNRAINFADITSVLGNFGTQYPGTTGPGDASLDGVVTFLDITTVLSNWGTTCG
jgi:Tol biopolymer transport system component